MATIWAHIQDPPPAPSAARPELPKGFDDVIARGMAKQPDERYATCRELVDAARRELGVSSGEISQPSVTTRRRRLDRRLLAAGSASVLVIAALIASLTRGGAASQSTELGRRDRPEDEQVVASSPSERPGHDRVGFGSICRQRGRQHGHRIDATTPGDRRDRRHPGTP